MPNEQEVRKSEKPSQSISMSVSEFQALISTAMKEAVQGSTKMLAEAMLESRKPYLDPKKQENEEKFKEMAKRQREALNERIAASRAMCPHLQGCNSESDEPGIRSSIIQHTFDNGVVLGICTNCQRVFKPTDPDYQQQMRRKSGNRPSSSGHRNWLDPSQAQKEFIEAL